MVTRRARLLLAFFLVSVFLTLMFGCYEPTPIVTGTRPTITSITFPAQVIAGVSYDGTVAFSDPDGDIVLVEFKSGGTTTGSFNPGVAGQTSGTFGFTQATGGAGYHEISVTLRDAQGNTGSPRSFSYTASPGIAYRVTVSQILAEFEANEIAAEMKYKGKTFAVSGYITDFGTYWNDEPIVWLGVNASDDAFDDQVLCYFPVERRQSVAGLSKGQYVSIAGEYWMYGLGNVYVRNCRVE